MAKVYVRTDEQKRVVEINSDIFLQDLKGWTQIDEGEGDRYAHAQGNYLDKPLMEDGAYTYKLTNKKLKERTEAEKEADRALLVLPVSLEERVADLESAVVEIVYGGEMA